MKNFFTGKNNKPLMGRVATLLMLGLIAANSLFATTPLFARSTTNTTNIQNSFKTFCHFYYYDGHDVATQKTDSKNCSGRSAAFSQFMSSIYTGTAWPKTSLQDLANKHKLKDTNNGDNLIKTQDDLQTAIDNFGNQPLSDLVDPSNDSAFLNTLWGITAHDMKNSQGASSSTNGNTEGTNSPQNKTVTFNQFKAIVEGFCQQFKTDVSNRLQPAESQGQQGHVDDLNLILDGSTSVSAVFTKDFYDQNPQNEDPEGEFFTSLDDVVQKFETPEIKDNISDFSTYDPSACNMYHTGGATAPSDSKIAKKEFDSYNYDSLGNGNIDSIVTDTLRAAQDSAPN